MKKFKVFYTAKLPRLDTLVNGQCKTKADTEEEVKELVTSQAVEMLECLPEHVTIISVKEIDLPSWTPNINNH